MTGDNTENKTSFLEGYHPGVIGRITELHGVYYAQAWGVGADFEGLVAQELHEFFESYQEARDLFLTAWADGRAVGSIAVQGDERERPGARLRWIIVEATAQGRGIGKKLFLRALEFCRSREFSTVYLWTVEGLLQSRSLYEQAGFHVVERVPDDRYSIPQVNLRMELNLKK